MNPKYKIKSYINHIGVHLWEVEIILYEKSAKRDYILYFEDKNPSRARARIACQFLKSRMKNILEQIIGIQDWIYNSTW